MTENLLTLNSHLATMQMKKYGLYCRAKSVISTVFRLRADTVVRGTCKHKFRKGQCQKCGVPEAIVSLGALRAGFHCNQVCYAPNGVSAPRSSEEIATGVSEDNTLL